METVRRVKAITADTLGLEQVPWFAKTPDPVFSSDLRKQRIACVRIQDEPKKSKAV
jgi:hypothetical protein